MAGDSGLPALAVDPLSLGVNNTARAVQTMSGLQAYQQQQAVQPGEIAAANAVNQAKTTMAPLEAQNAQYESQLKRIGFQNEALANVARAAQAADPEDAAKVWDDGMKEAMANGVPQAEQYISHYRPDLAEKVGNAYSAAGAGGRGAAGGAEGPGPATDPAIARAVAAMPAPQLQKGLGNINRVISGFNNVHDADSWNQELQALQDAGIDVKQFLPNLDWSPLNYAAASRMIQKLMPTRDAMAQRAALEATGAPVAEPAPLYEPKSTYIGTQPGTGLPVYHDATTGKDTIGTSPVQPKMSAGLLTFQGKVAAAKAAGMGDQEALDFANGKKDMSDAQMEEAAHAQASKDLADIALAGGQTPADPQAWIASRTSENLNALKAAQTANRGTPGGPHGGPQNNAMVTIPGRGPMQVGSVLAEARQAIQRKPSSRAAVINRLRSWGIAPAGL